MFNLIDTGGLLILPEHIWRDVGDDWRSFQPNLEKHPSRPDLTKMVGTGPFILVDHKPGEYWRLKWNPTYFKRVPERVEAPMAPAISGLTLPAVLAAATMVGGAAAVFAWVRWRRRVRGV
jgi:ABC-type transport system substrate-binding protein